MLQKLLLIFSAIITIFTFGYRKGKNDKTNEDNKTSADSVREYNAVKKRVNRLSDTDLDIELQKWRKVGK